MKFILMFSCLAIYGTVALAASDPNAKPQQIVYSATATVHTGKLQVVVPTPINIQILNFSKDKKAALMFLPSNIMLEPHREILENLSDIGETGNNFKKFKRNSTGTIHEEELELVFGGGFGQAGIAQGEEQNLKESASLLSLSEKLDINYSIVKDITTVRGTNDFVSCFSTLKVEIQFSASEASEVMSDFILTDISRTLSHAAHLQVPIEHGNLDQAIQTCISGLTK